MSAHNPVRGEQISPTADRRRTELVEAAYALIAEKGLEGLRTRDVAAHAGVNISTLHYYFPSKEDLIEGVVEYARDYFANIQKPLRARPRTSASKLLRGMLGSEQRKRFDANPDLYVVLQELVLRARRGGPSSATFVSMHANWDAEVAEVLRQGIEEGVFRADIDPELTASIITAYVIGASIKLDLNPSATDIVAMSGQLEKLLATLDARPSKRARRRAGP